MAAGLRLRDDSVDVAGKGTMRTYNWLATHRESRKQDRLAAETAPLYRSKLDSDDSENAARGSEADVLTEIDRLFNEWNVEFLSEVLKQVESGRANFMQEHGGMDILQRFCSIEDHIHEFY